MKEVEGAPRVGGEEGRRKRREEGRGGGIYRLAVVPGITRSPDHQITSLISRLLGSHLQNDSLLMSGSSTVDAGAVPRNFPVGSWH